MQEVCGSKPRARLTASSPERNAQRSLTAYYGRVGWLQNNHHCSFEMGIGTANRAARAVESR